MTVLTDEIWELAEAARNKVCLASEPRMYWYGAYPTRRGPRPFIVKDRSKIPEGALEVLGPILSCEEATSKAHVLAASLAPSPSREEVVGKAEVTEGSVARHHDSDGDHFVVALRLRENGDVPCLFFTSNALTGRQATKEEIGCAGFVTKKTTYVRGLVKSVKDMYPTGVVWSKERVDVLYKEFFGEG
jgi:hypothetical protein